MRRKLQLTAAATGLGIVLAGATAGATTGDRADLGLAFSTRAPGAPAALTIHILYKAHGDADAKPSPIRAVTIAAPEGTRFDLHAVPACGASDEELKAQGSGACPSSSRLGEGKLTAITGFGPPVDPVAADITLFNAGDGVIEVVTATGTDRVLGTDRLSVHGSTLTGDPPSTPGGPPDGETAIRQIDFTIDAGTRFVTTPPACPAVASWSTTGMFGFADGSTEVVRTESPCDPSHRQSTPGARLTLTPRHVRAGTTTRFTARVRGAAPGCTRGATVRVGGRRARIGANGRVRLMVTVRRRGAHRATAKKSGCRTLRAGLAVGAPGR